MKRYFDDYQVGESATTSGRTISDADFLLWGGVEHDYPAIHFDAPAMARTRFGGRIGAGFIELGLSVGMFAQHDLNWYWPVEAVTTVRWEAIRFVRPLLIGDTVYCEREITEAYVEDADFGILVHSVQVRNENGETYMEGRELLRIRRRPRSAEQLTEAVPDQGVGA